MYFWSNPYRISNSHTMADVDRLRGVARRFDAFYRDSRQNLTQDQADYYLRAYDALEQEIMRLRRTVSR